MDAFPTWQSILQQILKTPGEQQRMAVSIGLSQMTLMRWAKGESNPQRPHLTRLVQFIPPAYRDQMLEALEATYPDTHTWQKDESAENIPSEFIAQLLNVCATTIDTLRFVARFVLTWKKGTRQKRELTSALQRFSTSS